MRCFILSKMESPLGKSIYQAVFVDAKSVDHFLNFPILDEARSHMKVEAAMAKIPFIDLTADFYGWPE